MKYAPIIITTLYRHEHFRRLVESLKRNSWAKYTDVYVSIDYPPAEKYRGGWSKICEYVDSGDFTAFASFNVIKQKKNLGAGLNYSILKNHVAEHYDRWISTEDDNEFAPNFIEYMDKCLDAYENDPSVIGVTGYSYPISWDVSDGATCLRQNINASMWGTGSWNTKWNPMVAYIKRGETIANIDRVVRERTYEKMIDASLREYIIAAVQPYKRLNRMLYCNSDIGVRAYLAVDDKYFISPVVSKVRNYGFDGSGVYCQAIESENGGGTAGTYNYSKQPIDEGYSFEVVENTKESLKENRDRLNRFDKRTPEQMRRTRLYLWLMTHLGIWAGKVCATILFPFDITLRLVRKIIRQTKK